MIIDDTQMYSVELLCEFMFSDPHWEKVHVFGRTTVFKKTSDSALDVAWHMQPFITKRMRRHNKTNIIKRIFNKFSINHKESSSDK